MGFYDRFSTNILMKKLLILGLIAIFLIAGCTQNKLSNQSPELLSMNCSRDIPNQSPMICEGVVQLNSSFYLFTYNYQDAECAIPIMGGCYLTNVSYDKNYIEMLESEETGGHCDASETYRFVGIKKGLTEINTSGPCYDNIYRIQIS